MKRQSVRDLSEYYRIKRKRDFEHNVPLRGIKFRRMIHPIPLGFIKLDRILSRERIYILADKQHKRRQIQPTVYVCTHIGGNDIQRVFEAIQGHAYLFLGDPGELYRGILSWILFMNGVICLETRDKEDRRIAKARAIELLKKKGSLLIFPEGAWKVSPNLPVMKLFKGTAGIVKETGSVVVPIAVEQYDNSFLVNIGEEHDFSGSNLSEIELTDKLREILATLKWEIWERRGMFRRKSLREQSVMDYAMSVIDRQDYGYSLLDVLETMYSDKNGLEDSWVEELKNKANDDIAVKQKQ